MINLQIDIVSLFLNKMHPEKTAVPKCHTARETINMLSSSSLKMGVQIGRLDYMI